MKINSGARYMHDEYGEVEVVATDGAVVAYRHDDGRDVSSVAAFREATVPVDVTIGVSAETMEID